MRKFQTTVMGVLAAASLGGAGLAQTNPAIPPPAATKSKSWTDVITVKADGRLRFETINDDSKKDSAGNTYTRDRFRIRARVGAEGVVKNLKGGVRLSTGGADPVSGNQTLGDGDIKKEMRLELAYIEYALFAEESYELTAVGGKMNNPLLMFPDDLLWDSDLTPEGAAFKARIGDDSLALLLKGEGVVVQERNDKNNAYMLGAQAAFKVKVVPEFGFTVGGTYLAYQNLEGYDVIDWEGKNNSYGNSTKTGSISGGTTNKAWACEFTPLMGFAQVDVWIGFPVSLYGQYLTNPKADSDNKGYMGGITLGKAKNPQTFELGYSYAELQKDATVGMWTDSDRWGGGTDGKGHKFYGKYQILKNLQGGVTFFLDDKKISNAKQTTDYNRLQVDLAASF